MVEHYLEQENAVVAALVSQRKNAKDIITLPDKDVTNLEHLIKVLETDETDNMHSVHKEVAHVFSYLSSHGEN